MEKQARRDAEAVLTHIEGFHVYFDEKWIRPIFKQEKRKWVAVSDSSSFQRPPTPTVKPFLRSM